MGKERIVVITGANSGIGKTAAHMFAKEGHSVVMACRDLEKSKHVQQEIKEESNNTRIDLLRLDMSSFASIRQFCTVFKEKYERLDVLVHNAAYFNHGSTYRLSPDNIELTFATNTFGPYLMTTLLLEHLKKSSDARILHASSSITKHFFDPKRQIDFDQVIGEMENVKGFSVYNMYCQSKMALILLTFKMAKEFEQYGIKVNALQINGAKMSKETLQKVTPKWRMIARIQNLFFPPPEKMAEIYVYMCTSDACKEMTGKLMNDKKEIMVRGVKKPNLLMEIKQLVGTSYYPLYADQQENQDKMWELCEEVANHR
ncbi:SDR family NAD(P)-dependent oxidoreductase [Aquibacillus koreensis]|uniref:SDR family NAD(P)-dependent oxidoreductase n=1 Tax=Aquibacillus koreensis TaxID=279446 RepID=A0A9X3WGF7_9BACI|nr:SDR family NAD(P)-dependent oxidoreductase [Aquibacillus koreensis]MCT2536515.1 SDR family NAD(P)-dependent oxidoreductase [Aquibacillus koreensis]MDC3419397.1 SDR family NAD(P)-dependent oxidoreductase [Aquibacillus koreensis]